MVRTLGSLVAMRRVRVAAVLAVQLLPRRQRAPAGAAPVAAVRWRDGHVELASVVVVLLWCVLLVVVCLRGGTAAVTAAAAGVVLRAVVRVVGVVEGVHVAARAAAAAVVPAVFGAAALDAAALFFFCYCWVDDAEGLGWVLVPVCVGCEDSNVVLSRTDMYASDMC